MLRSWQILVSAIVLAINVASLVACGQQGALYMPPDPTNPTAGSLPEKPVRARTVNPPAQPDAAPDKAATPVTDPNQK